MDFNWTNNNKKTLLFHHQTFHAVDQKTDDDLWSIQQCNTKFSLDLKLYTIPSKTEQLLRNCLGNRIRSLNFVKNSFHKIALHVTTKFMTERFV